jgi:hypothetical protein
LGRGSLKSRRIPPRRGEGERARGFGGILCVRVATALGRQDAPWMDGPSSWSPWRRAADVQCFHRRLAARPYRPYGGGRWGSVRSLPEEAKSRRRSTPCQRNHSRRPGVIIVVLLDLAREMRREIDSVVTWSMAGELHNHHRRHGTRLDRTKQLLHVHAVTPHDLGSRRRGTVS